MRWCAVFLTADGFYFIDCILSPGRVHFRKKKTIVSDVWTAQYGTYVKDNENRIQAWGLNNYYQAGMCYHDEEIYILCCDFPRE